MDKEDLHYQFLLEEYKALRQEIDNTMAQIRRLVYLNLLGSGAIWYLIFTSKVPDAIKIPLYLTPTVISILCGIYIHFLRRDVIRTGHYIENEFLATRSLGWEHYLVALNLKGLDNTGRFERYYSFLVVIINFIGALLMYCADKY